METAKVWPKKEGTPTPAYRLIDLYLPDNDTFVSQRARWPSRLCPMSDLDPPVRGVRELRLVLTTDDYDATVDFYRDVLGMPVSAEYVSEEQGRVVILEAGVATLEIGDRPHAEYVDEVEVGRRVAGPLRVALRVDDVIRSTTDATDAGADVVAAPTLTPWHSRNARLEAPGGLQLTLYQDEPDGAASAEHEPQPDDPGDEPWQQPPRQRRAPMDHARGDHGADPAEGREDVQADTRSGARAVGVHTGEGEADGQVQDRRRDQHREHPLLDDGDLA